MKTERNVLDQFDALSSIEPSEKWNEYLFERLAKKPSGRGQGSLNKIVLLAILILITINLFSFSRSWISESKIQNADRLKNIAAEFLVNSNSSKF